MRQRPCIHRSVQTIHLRDGLGVVPGVGRDRAEPGDFVEVSDSDLVGP